MVRFFSEFHQRWEGGFAQFLRPIRLSFYYRNGDFQHMKPVLDLQLRLGGSLPDCLGKLTNLTQLLLEAGI